MEQERSGTRNLPRRHERYEGKRARTMQARNGLRSPILGLRRLPRLLVAAAGLWVNLSPLNVIVFQVLCLGQIHAPGHTAWAQVRTSWNCFSGAGGPTEYAEREEHRPVRGTTQQRVSINLQKMLYPGRSVSVFSQAT